MKRLLLSFIVLVFAVSPVWAQDDVWQAPKTVTYEQFLKWRNDDRTVVLDAYEMERFLHVGPERPAITQAEQDRLFAELIPSKETRIVLYCLQNFLFMRRIPARDTVAHYLQQLGYTDVYVLENLWGKANQGDSQNEEAFKKAKETGEKEVRPYGASLPVWAKEILNPKMDEGEEIHDDR
ncbi:MAG: rhodanese-like domain-containing protein [Rhodospirillales bacterium]|nr:rhodanese-like domain-containing protein [Rhodospirillales bacterium]